MAFAWVRRFWSGAVRLAFGRRVAARCIRELEDGQREYLARAAGAHCPQSVQRPDAYRRAKERLRACGRRAVPVMMAFLEKPAADQARKNVAFELAQALGSLGKEARAAVPALVRAYERDGHVFYLEALGQIGDVKALPCFAKALERSGPWEQRATAAKAIGQFRSGAAALAPRLCRVLAEERGDEVRVAVAAALGRIGDARALETLVVVAKESSRASAAAFQAIRAIGHPDAVGCLLEFIGTEHTGDIRDDLAARLDARCLSQLSEGVLRRIASLGLVTYPGVVRKIVDYRPALRHHSPEQANPLVPFFEQVEVMKVAGFALLVGAARAELARRGATEAGGVGGMQATKGKRP